MLVVILSLIIDGSEPKAPEPDSDTNTETSTEQPGPDTGDSNERQR